jgi:urease accessory protein
MRRADTHAVPGAWPGAEAADIVTLDFDSRHRRRILLATDTGMGFLLDLPEAAAMADGDGLRLEDGRWIRVRAAVEHVTEVRHTDPHQLVRLAWHLGNRHLPAEIHDEVLYIRPDHVVEDMLRGLGADLKHVERQFQPEGGAYGMHHGHSRDADD